MLPDPFHIVLFDGVCNLCDRTVRWITQRDKEGQFRFIALQSEQGKQVLLHLNLPEKESNSVIYINHQGIFTRSNAVLEILHHMNNGWSRFYFLHIVPKGFRDEIYDLIAKTRYRIFGKKEFCEVPQDLNKNRFVVSEEELMQLEKIIR